MSGPAWLDAHLSALAGANAPSMLEICCGDGTRLAQAAAAGVQPFGVEADKPARNAARQRCPESYISRTIEEIPPHRFDMILLSGQVAGTGARELFYELAAKGAFGPETIVIAMAGPAYRGTELAAAFSDLRFSGTTAIKTEDGGCRYEAHGSDFGKFMQERYVPGTWSEIAAYEHLPRYAYACSMAHGARVLDFGCGSGYGTVLLAEHAATVTGLDISEDALAYARSRNVAPNLTFRHDGTLGAALPPHSFDLIVCFEVIEHLIPGDQNRLPQALSRLLAPGGRLLISTPNPQVTVLYGANPYHLRELTEQQFAALLQGHFPHVALIEQSIHAGVFFQPAAGSTVTLGQAYELRDDVEGMAGPVNPAIFVAVCSAEPIPPQRSLVFPDRARDYVSLRIRSLGQRNQQLLDRYALVQARAQLARIDARRRVDAAELERLRTDRHRVEQELASSKGEHAAVLADRALLQTTYLAERAERERLTAAVAAACGEANRLRAEQDTAAAEIVGLQATLTEAVAETGWVKQDLGAALKALETEHQVRLQQLAHTTRSLAQSRAEVASTTEALAQLQLVARTEAMSLQSALAASIAETGRVKQDLGAELDQARVAFDALQAEHDAWLDQLALTTQALAQTRAELASTTQDLAGTIGRLAEIETSTSWRAIRRMVPLLRAARPVVRPMARAGWRLARRALVRPAPRTEPVRQLESAPELVTPPPAAKPRDLTLEIALDPVWDERQRAYVLKPDLDFRSPAQPSGTIEPYVVRPIHPVDPRIARPKLLHIIPNVHVGGSTQLVIDIVQHLSASFAQEVLTSSLWPGGAHDGLIVHHVPNPSTPELADVIGRVRPNLIHMHYWGLTDDPWYHSALKAMQAHKAPALQNVNTPIAPLIDEAFRHYVFVSAYVRQTFGGGVPDEQASVIHPGIDLRRFGGWAPSPDRENAIGMVYRLEDDKLNADAIDVFIEVARRRPRTKVYIIGGGRFLLPYLERTEAAEVRANFRFTGYVPYETLPEWYDRFAIFVAPVWKESFGQVVPFAMRKRAAVAGYAVGALPEILGSGETLADSVAETAAIITDLLNDPGRMHALGARNQARASELFAIDDMVERYDRLYRELLGIQTKTCR